MKDHVNISWTINWIDMGYPMALNLRKSLPESTILFVHDVVREKAEQFKYEAETQFQNDTDGFKVVILDTSKDVADNSVRIANDKQARNN